MRVVGASVMTRLLLSSPFDPSLPTNEHRNIIATETTTTSFIGKGRERTSRLLYREENPRRELLLLRN